MKLGTIVTLELGEKRRRPHVVVHEPVDGHELKTMVATVEWALKAARGALRKLGATEDR